MGSESWIIDRDQPILVTGAAGFIGRKVVANLVAAGFRHVRCFARPSGDTPRLILDPQTAGAQVEVVQGNLLSRDDCLRAAQNVAVIFHLAAARGEKSIPDAFMNSVVTTRNLLEAARQQKSLRRFVSISSFSVYSNQSTRRGVLDESAPVETRPELRGDAYSFAKVKQDEIVLQYGKEFNLPYVIVRPGYVYGPGNEAIPGRVGIGTFGIFLHLGGSNPLPLTYVDNCADAIVLAGLVPGIDREIFNVVDDNLPSSRQFLRLYKKRVKRIRSIYVPRWLSYFLCSIWEKYSSWSEGQLPLTFNRRAWHAYWKKTKYSNEKIKRQLSWRPKLGSKEALQRFFESCRKTMDQQRRSKTVVAAPQAESPAARRLDS